MRLAGLLVLALLPGCGPSGSESRHAAGSASSGKTSISLTTKSLSVPEVAANSSAETAPATVRSRSSGALTKLSTSGRPSTKRWSADSQVGQSPPG